MKTFAVLLMAAALAAGKDKEKKPEPSPIDRYIEDAGQRNAQSQASAGSLYYPGARWGDLSRDLRAAQVDDIVTIVVSDKASAESRGDSASSRKSSASGGISTIFGRNVGALKDMVGLGSDQQMQGAGSTSRESALSTTVSARVTHVLPNGYMVVEGVKETWINSERQQVSIRGVLRWNDLGPSNLVRSDRLANLEVRINGKGVVGDAVRRPNFLYRLLLGLLPF